VLNGKTVRTLQQGEIDGLATVARNAQGTLRPGGRGAHGGTTLAAVLAYAKIPRTAVRDVAVVNPARPDQPIHISPGELPGGFAGATGDDVHDALFDAGYEPGEIGFFRPLRNDQESNAADFFYTSLGTNVEVDVATENTTPISVTAAVEDPHPKPKTEVLFTSSSDAPDNSTYVWDFGDGASAEAQNATHGYQPGSYQAQVTVIAPDGSSGVSAQIAITVDVPAGGTATTPQAPTTPATAGSGGNGAGGGQAATGGGAGSKDAAAKGPRTGKGTGSVVQSDAAKGEPATSARTHARAKSKAETVGVPAAQAPAVTDPAPATPAPADAPVGKSPRPAPARSQAERQGTPATRGGTPVRGVVVAGTGGDLAGALVAADALAAGMDDEAPAVARAAAGHRWRPWGWAGGGAGLLALLALGALREGPRARRLRGSGRLRPV
jgi:hypothetical protein